MRKICILSLSLIIGNALHAQVYKTDSVSIEFRFKKDFSVREYKDLNIEVEYSCRPGISGAYVYDEFVSAYRSTFGNCFFEIYKWDSASSAYKNISRELGGHTETPMDVKTQEDIFKYDLRKTLLAPGKKRTLIFNLLEGVPLLYKGKYSLILYVRVGNKLGYDSQDGIIANSIDYIESANMNFDVLEDVSKHRGF